MKKIFIISAAIFALASCGLKEEFQPVFTGKYDNPVPYTYWTDADCEGEIISISSLVSSYTSPGTPVALSGMKYIKGRVSTTDQPGNFYKSFFLQDETGGIEIKVGRNSLYNDYLQGQTIYVLLDGLTLGMYGYNSTSGYGTIQLGYKDESNSYETAYLEEKTLIDSHILRGDPEDIDPVAPLIISSASDLPESKDTQSGSCVGSLVTLEGLSYSNKIFCIIYADYNTTKSDKIYFRNGDNFGVTTWAMSKSKMNEYLMSGVWDKNTDVSSKKGDGSYPEVDRAAYSVSQYFKMGSKEIQIRTSGFCKFCDLEIPADVLNGSKKINVTGIISLYQGGIQFTVNSQYDITYEDGTPIYTKE